MFFRNLAKSAWVRWLDLLHARYHNDGLFFSDGWGHRGTLELPLVQLGEATELELAPLATGENTRVLRFLSPFHHLLPEQSTVAEALLVLPLEWTLETPICIQLASTGDEGFATRRELVAEPLLRDGIGSIIVENPYYGSRRPARQQRTYLRTVSDLWAMGLSVVAETRALLHWLKRQGFQNLGVVGVSMGGAMASQATSLTPFPLAMCSCIAPHCASGVFLEGVLSRYVDFAALGGERGRARLREQLDGSDLSLFPQPRRGDCAIWLAARKDAYVSPESSLRAWEIWPGSHLRWLNNGHIGTAMFHRNDYLKGIRESFRRLQLSLQLPTGFP